MIRLIQIRYSRVAHAHEPGPGNEVREPVALLFEDPEILVAQPEVERQAWRDFPIVLDEEAVVVGASVAPGRAAQDRRARSEERSVGKECGGRRAARHCKENV